MISVTGLTKQYGSYTAVDQIDFHIKRGELIGFLGANGAGKTTTMRMLTGYMAPTSGTVTIAGLDMETHPLEAKQNIGYLAENNPLYLEMRVFEYLRFRARLKGVAEKEVDARVQYAMDKCWIEDVEQRIIGQLSKGYRQRVGLADALVHNPEILILDEPTVGLDPHQIIKTRELIKSLSHDHTIMLSSHILPEVEMVCDRIIIINQGKIVAEGSPDELREQEKGMQQIRLSLETDQAEAIAQKLETVADVIAVSVELVHGGLYRFEMDVKEEHDIRDNVLKFVLKNKWDLQHFEVARSTLEDIFVQITKEDVSS